MSTSIPVRKLPVINQFKDAHKFLSNMFLCDVLLDGVVYPSAENAFQSLKTSDPAIKTQLSQMGPYEAKRFGAALPGLDVDAWNRDRVSHMRQVLRLKFTQNPDLAERLLATGGSELIEGNYHNDVFWGYSLQTHKGENWLGHLLESLRQDLRQRNIVNAPLVGSRPDCRSEEEQGAFPAPWEDAV